MSVVCMAAGAVVFIYYLILVIYAGITADFIWIWLFGAAALGGAGWLLRYGKNHPGFFPQWMKYGTALILTAGILLFLILCAQVIKGMKAKELSNLDYVVVLGAHVKKDVPSKALEKRLRKAKEYAEANPETVLILSGGQGTGEEITEAQCMKEYLMARGIGEKRLVLEEHSTDTRENLQFSNEITGCSAHKTGILSNNFHVYRAVLLARKLGYENPAPIPAPSDPIMQVHYVVREVFALVKERLKGNI